MGELYEPFPKLPKNIRQIGERDQVLKFYLEDYVNTYLKRLQPAKGADLRVGLLLGSRETHEDTPYVFVDGALEMDAVTQEGEKVVFTEDAWKKAYQDVEQMFPKRTVQGWFLCGSPGCALSPLNYWRQHSQYFTGKNQLMYLNCGLEGDESIYITSSDGFYKLRGYSVYYERNQIMQDYMIQRQDAPRAEAEVNDKVIRSYKQRMDERKHEMGRHKSTVGILSGLCSVLAVTVLAGGVAMFNNYQKMHEMESVIASVLPDGDIKQGLLASSGKQAGHTVDASKKQTGHTVDSSGKGWTTVDGPDYEIEEAAGNVYPTTAPAEEGKEQSAQIAPETMPAAESSAHETMPAAESSAHETMPATKGSAHETMPAAESSAHEIMGTPAETVRGDEKGQEPGAGDESSAQSSSISQAGKDQPMAPKKPAETASKEETTLPPTGGRGEEQAESASAINYSVYTVEDGETLYGICFKLYHSLKNIDEICQVNALTDQNSIYAGQKLLVP